MCALACMSDGCLCPLCACVRAQLMSFGAEVQRKTAEPSLSLPWNWIGGVLSAVNKRSVDGFKVTPFCTSVAYPPDEADVDYP